MKTKTLKKKVVRRAARKPAAVKLAVKSTPKRAVRFSLVMIPMGVAALVIAFVLSMLPAHITVAQAYGGSDDTNWNQQDHHDNGDNHNGGDDNWNNGDNGDDHHHGHDGDGGNGGGWSNTPPVAINQTLTTAADTALSITLAGTDADNDALTFATSSSPTNGALSGTAPSLTYTPDSGWSGNDSFTFTVSDGHATTSGTVSITVSAPVTPPTPVCSQGVGSPLLVDATQHITGDPDSSVPGQNWATDTFTRHIQVWQETIGSDTHYCAEADDNGTFATNGTISPQSGTALPQIVTGTMVGGTHGEIVGGTLTSDQPAIADVDCTTAPSGSCDSLTSKWVAYYFGNSATYSYSPSPADSTGNWGWTYTADCNTHDTWVNQNAGNSGDIVAGNDCSVVTATNQSVTTAFNTPINITLAGTDSISGKVIIFATSSNPSDGTLATTSDAATFTYAPNSGFSGNDSFTFTAGDGMSTSTGTVSITVNAQDNGGNGGTSNNSTPRTGGGGGVVVSGPLSIGYVNTNTGGSTGSTGGSVLGAETETPNSCSAYLTGYMGYGKKNDSDQVKKLQSFLNTELGLSLTVSGTFDLPTLDAVKQFQIKYWDSILKPWVPFGLPSDHAATGYVYKTTLRQINNIECASLNLPLPQLP
ncbi:MAG TPA: Ig-like domain-containing protein [Candidatus Paceibacterota bacterium]|nr:Ig-like domain-containing protein [Candidatus Paceibacterota bacterium]